MNIQKAIKKKLESSKNIALFGHTHIDWDAIWSMLWLWRILEKQWKNVTYFTPTKPETSLCFVNNINKIKNNFDYAKDYDCLVFLDFSDYNRIDTFTNWKEKYFDKNFLIIIDHHQWKSPEHTDIALKDITAQSSCDIIFELCEKERPKLIDEQTANYLYLWITTDSWNFIFWSNKSSIRTFWNAKKLLEKGADKPALIKNIFYQQSFSMMKFIEKIIKRSKISWKILYTYYTDKDLKKYNIDSEQAKLQFNSIITKTFWPELIILFKIIIDKTKWKQVSWSIRRWNNEKQINHNCGQIAHDLFNGGGHKWASGFRLASKWPTNKQIKKALKLINNYITNN